MIRAAIFDLDGLLIDSEPFWQGAEREVFARVGVRLSDDDLCRTIGMRIDEVVRFWHRQRPWDLLADPVEAVANSVVDGVVAGMQRDPRPLPGVVATLDQLTARGIRLGVASSSPMRVIEGALAALQLRHYFVSVNSAETESCGKPDPGVYRSAMAALAIEGSEGVAFEDSVTGLLSAKAAGLTCVAVPEPRLRNHAGFAAADLVLDSLVGFDLAALMA